MAGVPVSAVASKAGSSAASSAASNAASNASTKAVSNAAPKTGAPNASAPSASAPTSAPSTSAPSAPSQAPGTTSAPQTSTPTGEVVTVSSDIPNEIKTEGGNAKPLEEMDADELQNAGADTSEGDVQLGDQGEQPQRTTPEDVVPDQDELTVSETQDSDLAETEMDPDQIQEIIDEEEEEERAAQAEAEAAAAEGPQPGDSLGFGQEVGEDGLAKEKSTSKVLTVVGKGVATYFGGEAGLEAANQLEKVGPVKDVIGVASDVLEATTPGLKEASDELEEVADAVNDVANAYSKVKGGDIVGAANDVKHAKDSLDKKKEKIKKQIKMALIQAATYFLLTIVIVLVVVGPIVGGVMYLTEKIVELYNYVKNAVGEFFEDISLGIIESISYQDMLNDTPGYNSLNENRQKLISTAYLMVGMPYEWGGKPAGPGLTGVPSSGLDCSGFVKWVYWTALGEEPAFLSTWSITESDETKLVEISYEELQPGDIGLRRTSESGHTGIYAGNGMWIHEASESVGCVRNYYKNFTKFYRHVDVDK